MSTIVIVGGGIIGLLSAFKLKQAGFEVIVIERGQAGQESSWAGGGIISPLLPWRYDDAISRLAQLSQQLYPVLLDQLRAFSDIDPNYLHSGMIMLDSDLNDTPSLWAKKFKVNLQRLVGDEIRTHASETAKHFEQAWWMPDVHQIRNPFFVALLREAIVNTGVRLIENRAVESLWVERHRILGVRTVEGNFKADQVVIAGGAWTRDILGELGQQTEVYPVKGQMMLLKGQPGLMQRIVLQQQQYIIPRKDGHVLVGSTTEHTAFDKQVSEDVTQQLMQFAEHCVPSLSQCEIKQSWCGLRPGTQQGIPFISAHPEVEGLYINAGQYRNGIVTAPASVQLLCELLGEQQTSLNPQDYIIGSKLK